MSTRKCYLCSAKSPAVSLHTFPKNVEESSRWKEICGLRQNDDVAACFICSRHFIPSDYIEPNAKAMGGSLRLKPKRFPSKKVPYPIHVQCDIQRDSDPLSTSMIIVSKKQPEPCTSTTFKPTSSCSTVALSTSTVHLHEPESSPFSASQPLQEPTTSTVTLLNNQTDDTIFHTPKKIKFFDPRFVGDISSPDLATPKKAMRAFTLLKDRLTKEIKKNRALVQKNRRLIKKVATMQDMINHLKKKSSQSEDFADT